MKRDVKMWVCGWCGKMCFLYSSAERPEHCPYGLPGSAFSPIGPGVSEIAVAKPKSPEVADISDVFVEVDGDKPPRGDEDKGETPRSGEHFVYRGEFAFEGKTFRFPKFYPGRASAVRADGGLVLCGAATEKCAGISCEDCLLCASNGDKAQKERVFAVFIERLSVPTSATLLPMMLFPPEPTIRHSRFKRLWSSTTSPTTVVGVCS